MSGFPAYWTAERIVDAIRQHVEAHGEPPKYHHWVAATPATPATNTVRTRFGTFNSAIVAAGFEPRAAHRNPDWPKERIIRAVKEWTAEHGDVPRNADWLRATPATPCGSTCVYQFGSWNAMLEAAGFSARAKQRATKWTRDTVAAAMLDHLMVNGRWPTFNQWRRAGHGVRPNSETVIHLFGSWFAAKIYAGWDTKRRFPARSLECSGCGGELGNATMGCKACWDRKRHRERRAASRNGTSLAVVESPLTPGDSDPAVVEPAQRRPVSLSTEKAA